jgi:glucose/arabinose dehydrogenase
MLGFKGEETLKRPSDARWRPCGLAIGPDGAVYLVEAVEGRIWRVTWNG